MGKIEKDTQKTGKQKKNGKNVKKRKMKTNLKINENK